MPDPRRVIRRDPGLMRPVDPVRDRLRDVIRDWQPPIDLSRDRVDGIFEGGGALGTAYVGALLAMEHHRIWFHRVAGTSAGAITAAMVAAGYSAREIAWLTAPPDALTGLSVPTSMPPDAAQMAPIQFSSFIDPPDDSGDIPQGVRRSTMLWNALNMTVIEELRQIEIDVPTREDVVGDLADQLMASLSIPPGSRAFVEDLLRGMLVFLPISTPRVGDFLPFPPAGVRRQFADVAWSAIGNSFPAYLVLVNVLTLGGFAQGDVFRRTMRRLVGAKVAGDADANVTMGELPMHLTVIGANAANTTMEIYSSTHTPDVPVADAVRASMAIPFFFEPFVQDGADIVDGGMFSNYPFWLYTGGGSTFVTATPEDDERTKLGFILDDLLDPDPGWGAPPPKLQDASGRGLRPSHRETLEAMLGMEIPEELVLLDRIFGIVDIVLQREKVFSPPLRTTARAHYPFHEVEIPLRGFDWLDFSVNSDVETFSSMVFRGWEAFVRTPYFTDLVSESERKPNPFG